MRRFMMPMVAMTLLLTGCQSSNAIPTKIEREIYEKNEYSGITVQKGNLTPEFYMELRQDGMSTEVYSIPRTDLILDKVYVSVGQKVREGQLMISFKSEEIEQKKKDKERLIADKQLLIEHYQRLADINPKLNYSKEITRLLQDIELEELYIEEYDRKLSEYQIVAKKSGTVTSVNKDVAAGYLLTDYDLVRVASGNGDYKATTNREYDFKIGSIMIAQLDGTDYELRVKSVYSDESIYSGRKRSTVIFEPLSDMSALSDADTPKMRVVKDTLKDVVYVNTRAIRNGNNGKFVYVVGEDGYLDAVNITVGEEIGEYTVVLSGLNSGEEVLKGK